jgi:hypothetical protein
MESSIPYHIVSMPVYAVVDIAAYLVLTDCLNAHASSPHMHWDSLLMEYCTHYRGMKAARNNRYTAFRTCSFSHQTSLTKHKFKNKNFKMTNAEH